MIWYVLDITNFLILAATNNEEAAEKTAEVCRKMEGKGEIIISPTSLGCQYSSRAVGREIEKRVRRMNS
jgi:hypothetical protein